MKTLFFLLVLAMAFTSPAQAQNTQLTIAQAAVVGTTTSSSAALYVGQAVADAQGNTYVAGIFGGTVRFGAFSLTSAGSYDVFVAKRDVAGTYLWAAQGGGQGNNQVRGLAVDAAGDAVVTGYFSSRTTSFGGITLTNASPPTASPSSDVFVAKLSGSSRAWQWAVSAGGGTNINGDDQGTAVAVDVFGNVYVAGTFDSSVAFFGPSLQVANPYPGFDNVFLGKLTPGGVWAWAKGQQYMGSGASGLSIDANQNVYLTGNYGYRAQFGLLALTSLSVDVFITKIDGNGSWQWATSTRNKLYGGSLGISAATPNGQHSLYVSGSFIGDSIRLGTTLLTNTGAISPPGPSGQTRRTANAFVARLNSDTGAWQWAVQTTGAGSEGFSRPLLDNVGHIYASGTFGEPNFQYSPGNGGNTFGTTTLYSAGSNDIVVAQLDTTGRWLWARQVGGGGSEGATLCRVDAQGRGTLLGAFTGATALIGQSSLVAFSPAQADTYFTAELGSNGPLASPAAAVLPAFEVYPNPAHRTVTVAGLAPGLPVQLIDVLGRVVLQGVVLKQGALQWLLPAELPTGLYLVRAGRQARRLVVE